MLIKQKFTVYTFLIIMVSLISILICVIAIQKADVTYSLGYEVPIYKIPMSESTQIDMWKLCEENDLSYELVLSIYQVEGINDIKIDKIKSDIDKLVGFRDYWAKQGFPDEIVFNLMLLSREKGINNHLIMAKDDNYTDDYVQKVTEHKYALEQNIDTQLAVVK